MKGQANNETSVGGEGMEEEVGTGGGEGGLARKDAAVKPCKKQCYRFGTDSCLHVKVAGGRRRKATWGVCTELMFVLQANFANVSFHPKGSLNFKKLCMVELHSTNDGAALAPALQNLKTLLRYLDRKTSHDERRICEVW